MKIIFEDDVPIFQHSRRTSYENRILIEKYVQEWLMDRNVSVAIIGGSILR